MAIRLENQELRCFVAVVEEGAFKRAADALSVSQSAVSQAVSGLERKLQQRLLQRSPLAPTAAGRRLLAFAQRQLREEEVLLEELDDMRRGQFARLSLAVNPAINRYHAPALVDRFCRATPFARLLVEELPSRQVIEAVVGGRCELGMGPFQTRMPALDCQPLFDEMRLLVIARDHPLCQRLVDGDASALAKIPLLASYLDEPEQRPGDERLRDRFREAWQVRSISLRLQLLAAGHAVGYVSDLVMAREPLCAGLVEIAGLPFSRIRRQVGVFSRRESSLSAGARTFLRLCRETWP